MNNPYIIVVGIFLTCCALASVMFFWQKLNGKKLRARFISHSCPYCHCRFGTAFSMVARDIGTTRRAFNPEVPQWVWVLTCPHCQRRSEYTEYGELYREA